MAPNSRVRYTPNAMVNLPRWLIFLVAFWVIAFGAFRIYVAKQKLKEPDPKRPNFRRGGLYAQSRRRHIVFGFAYLLLGAVLIAMGLGFEIPTVGSCVQDDAAEAQRANDRAATPAEKRSETGAIEATTVTE